MATHTLSLTVSKPITRRFAPLRLILVSLGAVLLLALLAQTAETVMNRPFAVADVAGQQVGPGELPEGLNAGEWSSIQEAVAAGAYYLAWHEAAEAGSTPYYWAPNQGQGLDLLFNEEGVHVSPRQGAWAWGLSLAGYGYAGSGQLAASRPQLAAEEDSLTYTWENRFSERWANRAEGLEQRFIIGERPSLAAAVQASPLIVGMAVDSSLTGRQEGQSILFQGSAGETALRYELLQVVDAKGRNLPAQLAVGNQESAVSGLQIRIDDSSAVYPLMVNSTVINELAKLTTGGGMVADYFGYSVAVSGDTVAVGAYRNDSGGKERQGAAYVFSKPAGGWTGTVTQLAKLVAGDGAAQDEFGRALAVDGGTVVVGAPRRDVGGKQDQGAVYVFVEPGAGWSGALTQNSKLTASDGAAFDVLGNSVSVSGDTVAAGANWHNTGGKADQGAAYVFVKPGGGWSGSQTENGKLTSSDGAANDEFGIGVSVSGDTVVAGAYAHATGGVSGRGAAYVFVKQGGGWSGTVTQDAKLTAGDGAQNDHFGIAVAVSVDTVLVGANGHATSGNSDRGAAYVFVKPAAGGGWSGTVTQDAKLTSADGREGDVFGTAVSISLDTAVVGAPLHDIGGKSGQGAAYVFVKPGGGWSGSLTQDAKLAADDGAAGDNYGDSVAISGDTVVSGAPFHDTDGNSDQGAAYVSVKPSGAWSGTVVQDAKLSAIDGAAGDLFGHSVAISGDTVAVGAYNHNTDGNQAQGAAYIFAKPVAGWSGSLTQIAKLVADDGASNDYFGSSVAIEGSTVVVGAYLHDTDGDFDRGAAYLFVKPGGTWSGTLTQNAKLKSSDGMEDDNFGREVAIDGNTIVIGADGHATNGNSYRGAAYVFVKPNGGWSGMVTESAKLVAGDGATNDEFGRSVSVSADTAVVGARYHDTGGNSAQGAAYLFAIPAGGWSGTLTQDAKLVASDGAANDEFGKSVAISINTVVVGADRHNTGGNSDQGAAYIFVKPGGGWPGIMTQNAKLVAGDGATNDVFGQQVAASGSTVVVGANGHDTDGNNNQGAAYLFTEPESGWTGTLAEDAKPVSSDGAAGDRFGIAVAAGGDAVVVGADGHDTSGNSEQGAAYIFPVVSVPGTILVDMVSDPSGDPTLFNLTLSAGPSNLNQSFQLADTSIAHNSGDVLPGGGYKAAVAIPLEWQLTSAACDDGSPVDNIDVIPGETVTCTFSLQKLGRIIIKKEATPADGTSFDFSGDLGVFTLHDGASKGFENLILGDRVVVEKLPEDWILENVTCSGGASTPLPNGIKIHLKAGNVITCTFNNRTQPLQLNDLQMNPATIDEGDSSTLSGKIGGLDANASYRLTVAWGDGQSNSYDYPAGTTSFSVTHTYPDDDPLTGTPADDLKVKLLLTDSSDNQGANETVIRVNNVAPSVEAGPNQTTAMGEEVSFTGSFTDPGLLDTHTVQWDFGDGETATGSLTPKHVYTKGGNHTVRLTVTDDDSGANSSTLTVAVRSMTYLPVVLDK